MEIVWRQCESDAFYGDQYGKISLDIVWGFHSGNMVIQITRQSPYQFHHKISIKSIILHTVTFLFTSFLQIMETKYLSSGEEPLRIQTQKCMIFSIFVNSIPDKGKLGEK